MTEHKKNALPLILLLSVFFGVVFLMYAGQEKKEIALRERAVAAHKPVTQWRDGSVVSVAIGDVRVKAEVAAASATKQLGLGKRKTLEENAGMLFVFDKVGVYPFWNRDMFFSIDMLWIRDGVVIDIYEKLPDFASLPNFTVTPSAQANFVLEVNEGFIKKHAIKKGDVATYTEL